MRKILLLACFIFILKNVYANDDPKRNRNFQIGFVNEIESEDAEDIKKILEERFKDFTKFYRADINSIANTLAHILTNSNLSYEVCKSIIPKLNERNRKIEELANKILHLEKNIEELKNVSTTYYFPEKSGSGAIVNNNDFYFYLNSDFEPIKKDNKLKLFQEARSFSLAGYAVIKENNQYKIVDRNFSVSKTLDYDLVGEFNYGLALVKKRDSKSKEDRYGFIDENFQLVEKRGHLKGLRYENATSFGICGLAIVHLRVRKYLIVNSQGKIIYNGKAETMPTIDADCNSYFKKKNRERKITKDGRKHSSRGVFYRDKEVREGLSVMEKKGRFGFCNEKGDYLDPIQGKMVTKEVFPFYEVTHFNEGYAVVRDEYRKYGYINNIGKFVNSGGYEYDEAHQFSSGRAVVKKGSYYSIINTSFHTTNMNQYTYISDIGEGKVAVREDKNDNYTYFIYVANEQRVCPDEPQYRYAEIRGEFSDGCIAVKKFNSSLWGILNLRNENCQNTSFSHRNPKWKRFTDGYFKFSDYYVDETGSIIDANENKEIYQELKEIDEEEKKD